MITGILFFIVDDGLIGGLSGGSEEPGSGGSGEPGSGGSEEPGVGELRALRFFWPRVTSVNASSPADGMI